MDRADEHTLAAGLDIVLSPLAILRRGFAVDDGGLMAGGTESVSNPPARIVFERTMMRATRGIFSALDADTARTEHKKTPHQRAGTLRGVFWSNVMIIASGTISVKPRRCNR